MAKTGYSVLTPAPVALVANTAKSVVGVLAPAACGLDLKKIRVGLYGISASGVPGDIELCAATFATNAPGAAGSTSVTPQQLYGRTIAAGFLAAAAWTAEPTVLTVIDAFPLSPNGGLVHYDIPLGDTPDCGPGTGFVLRAKYAAPVSISAGFWVERA
ncbi:hypothetical protein [Nonomuraea sediminis]|uniref:hypothetical protein n=1 Tax=Nonomuraea sediminis TaxID=2835864 RepID=UPI001BDCF7B6|nr:hypothetical protein [Nonomuraea sediminis]